MGRIDNISSKQALKVFQKIGFEKVSQKGSHIKMRRYVSDHQQTITIPDHKRIKTGTLVKGILRPINLSIEDFLKLLKNISPK